jgi:hypothetical protein
MIKKNGDTVKIFTGIKNDILKCRIIASVPVIDCLNVNSMAKMVNKI